MKNIRQLLNEILQFNETILDKNILKAIMLVGGPGSGKSYIVKQLQERINPFPKIVNSDKIFEAKLKSNNLSTKLAQPGTDEYTNQSIIRNKAIQANVQALKSHLNGFLPIIIDGTGKNYQKTVNQSKTLEDLGYDVMCLMVNTNLEVAQERNASRLRSLPPDLVTEFWTQCQKNFKSFPDAFHYHLTINNDPGKLDIDTLTTNVSQFLNQPLNNPIGKELYNNRNIGPINRNIDPDTTKSFT